MVTPKKYILSLILSALAISCSTIKEKGNKTDIGFDTLSLPRDSTVLYFKAKKNSNDTTLNTIDSFSNIGYSVMLYALKEPILCEYQGDKEIYRFTWLRTFHHPVSVKLEKQNDIIRLFVKICNGASGYDIGKLIFDTTINVTQSEYKLLTQKVSEINFWNLPTEELDLIGNDGSEWIIEVVKDNKYHVVTKWSPKGDLKQDFRTVGEYLISLSRISEEETKNFY